MKIKQGEIWWINPTPKMGSQQKGKRPALIIQNDIANEYLRTTIVAIISGSGQSEMPEMIGLDENDGVKKGSYADFAQIFTIDKARLERKIGLLKAHKWSLVERALATIFERIA